MKYVAVSSVDEGVPTFSSGIFGLFGWSTVGVDTTEVVLTMSEMNAMAVYQETKVPVLSLPKGYNMLAQEVGHS